MALISCWRCIRIFTRASPQPPITQLNISHSTHYPPLSSLLTIPDPRARHHRRRPFSSTAAAQKTSLVKKKTTLPQSNQKAKGSATLKIQKKAPPTRVSKPGEVGARRAERKKIVLANPNATDVELDTLRAKISGKADGDVVKFDGPTIDMLRLLEVFQLKQGWQFFHRPSTLIRKESIELGKLLAWVNGERVYEGEDPNVAKVESESKLVGEGKGGSVSEGVSEEKEKEEGVRANEGGDNNNSEVKSANGSENKNKNMNENENESMSEDESDSGVGEQVVEEKKEWTPSGGYVTTPEVIPEVLIDEMNKYKNLAGESRSGRRVITGPKGVGKSILLLQAMAWAQQRNWFVLPIPNAQDLVISHTEYEHDLTSNLWLQKTYTSELLQRLLKANRSVLNQTQLSQPRTFGYYQDITIQQSEPLYKLVELGALDAALAWDVFTALLDELALPGRPPTLFTLDNLNYISLPSAYRDTEHRPIHAHDLALPRYFLDYLSGHRTFWRGLTLAATTARAPATPALAFALAHEPLPPYMKLDPRISPSIAGAPVMNVSPLTKPQARALMTYYLHSGLYNEDVDRTLAEKWVLSSGIPKELLRVCLRIKY